MTDEAWVRHLLAQRVRGPIELTRWLERARLNRIRVISRTAPLAHWPRTDAEAHQWAAREAQGFPLPPPNPADPAAPVASDGASCPSPGSPL